MLKRLAELSELNEAGITSGLSGVVSSFKKGYNDARAAQKKASDDSKAATDKEKAAAEKAKQVSPEQAKDLQTQFSTFIQKFFDEFPNGDATDEQPNAMLGTDPTRAKAAAIFKMFKDAGTTIETLRHDMNKSLVQAGRISKEQFKQADAASTTDMNTTDEKFVKTNADFFKKLFIIDKDFALNTSNFKQLISIRMKATDRKQSGLAATELNRILGNLAQHFIGRAEVVAKAAEGIKEGLNEDEHDQAERAKERKKDAEDKRKEAEREAEQKQREAEAAAKKAVDAEKKIQGKAEKEAEASAKAAGAEHKAKSAEAISTLKKDLETFVGDFFDRFPSGANEHESANFMAKYPTREAALAAFKAFRDISKRLDQLLAAMNKALRDRNKITAEQLSKYQDLADLAKAGKLQVSRNLIQFARDEAKFFKRLLTITDDNKLHDDDFKQLLALKMNQTNPARIPDAAEALNRLLGSMIAKLNARAKAIADIGRTLDDENVTTKKATRDAARAAAAAETETIAKASGF